MSLIRATLLLCITILLSVGANVYTNSVKDRFEIVPLKEGVFIFDRQTSASNFCNDNKCIVLSSEFLIPKKVLVSEIPGVATRTQLQAQNPAAVPSSQQVPYSAGLVNSPPASASPPPSEPSLENEENLPAAPMMQNPGQGYQEQQAVAPSPLPSGQPYRSN